jgi:hypothetical protein
MLLAPCACPPRALPSALAHRTLKVTPSVLSSRSFDAGARAGGCIRHAHPWYALSLLRLAMPSALYHLAHAR